MSKIQTQGVKIMANSFEQTAIFGQLKHLEVVNSQWD